MKKIYFIALVLSAYINSFANTIHYNVSQNSWRWRNNDGSETTASWKAGQDTATSYNAINEVVRLRIEMVNISTSTGGCGLDICPSNPYTIPMFDSLQFSTTPGDASSWKNIGFNASLPFVMANADNYIVQDEATTSQLTGSSYTFSAGKIMVSDSVIKNMSIPSPARSEFEWVITGTSNIAPGTTYYFRQRRIYFSNPFFGTSAISYPVAYPSLTTSAILPINLASFTANNEGKKVKLAWSTASEENTDYFNVQRSTDGRSWEIINKVKGKGNSSVATNYTMYDNNPPLNGIIYYRLQQYDKDGKYTFSEIRSVKMFATSKAIVSIVPNPAGSTINFKLENTAAKNVQVVLTDVNGRVIHEQAFENVQRGSINKLNLQHLPAPGIYLLELKGEGLLENIEVVVQ